MKSVSKAWIVNFHSVSGKVATFSIAALYLLFPTFIGASHLALFFLIVLFFVNFDRARAVLITVNTPALWAFIFLYLIVVAGALYTPASREQVIEHLGKYSRLIYPAVLLFFLWQNSRLQKVALYSFAGGMMFVTVSAWLSVFFVLPWSASKTPGWGNNHYVFGDHITQNVMMAFFVIIALHHALHVRLNKHRWLWLICAVLALMSITHLSHGRTGLLVLSAGLTAYAFAFFEGKRLASVISMLCLGIAALVLTSSSMQSRWNLAIAEAEQSDSNKETSIGHRLYNYKITPQLIAEAPIFGHGTAAYHNEICKFVQPTDRCYIFNRHPHNQFLFIGADHGIIGIILYSLLLVLLFYAANKSSQPDARLLLYAFASILLFDSLINSPLYSSRESQFFSYMAALLLSMASTSSRSGSDT